jgi:uncharacterized membrane protein YkvA (DUF1232 family)
MSWLREVWRNLTTSEKFWALFLVAYIISPIDLLPEAFLGVFGLVDDAGAFVLLVKILLRGNARRKQALSK